MLLNIPPTYGVYPITGFDTSSNVVVMQVEVEVELAAPGKTSREG